MTLAEGSTAESSKRDPAPDMISMLHPRESHEDEEVLRCLLEVLLLEASNGLFFCIYSIQDQLSSLPNSPTPYCSL